RQAPDGVEHVDGRFLRPAGAHLGCARAPAPPSLEDERGRGEAAGEGRRGAGTRAGPGRRQRRHRRALVLGGRAPGRAGARLQPPGSSGNTAGHGPGSALADAGEAVARDEGTTGDTAKRLSASARGRSVQPRTISISTGGSSFPGAAADGSGPTKVTSTSA